MTLFAAGLAQYLVRVPFGQHAEPRGQRQAIGLGGFGVPGLLVGCHSEVDPLIAGHTSCVRRPGGGVKGGVLTRCVQIDTATVDCALLCPDDVCTVILMNTERFWATIEFLPGQPAAIITLTDSRGEWSGAGRIDLPRCPASHLRAALYEAGYIDACARALSKGGTLDRFSEVTE